MLLAPIEIRRPVDPAFRQISATGMPSSPCGPDSLPLTTKRHIALTC